MKKVGIISESRMAKPSEPKFHPLVSDSLFENAVKGYPSKGIKGGTAAAKKMAKRKKLEEDDFDLPMFKRDKDLNTNSPRRATSKSVQVGGPFDLTAEDKKDDDWIQGAEADIKRRGTKGKCTPITKPGCTGKAKALAKTFKKMAKKRDAQIVSKKEKAAMKEQDTSSPTANFPDPKYATPKMRDKMKKRAEAIKKFQDTLRN